MQRFFLLLIVTVSALHATSYTFSTCTLGTTTITTTAPSGALGEPPSCTIPYIVDDNPAGNVQASAYTSFLFALAEAGIGIQADVSASAAARAGDSETLYTAGPKRVGLISFEIDTGHLHAGPDDGGVAGITDGVHEYDTTSLPPIHCDIESCVFTGILPFDLGSGFKADVSATAGPRTYCCGGTDSSAQIIFSLFEADGRTPVPYFFTPEPSTWGLLASGLAACVGLMFRRSRRAA